MSLLLMGAGPGVDGASFDANFEYSPDVGFDIPADWAGTRCGVSGSAANFTGLAAPVLQLGGTNAAAPLANFAVGTFRFVLTVASFTAGGQFPTIAIGLNEYSGTGAVAVTGPGTYTVDVVVTGAVATQTFQLKPGSNSNFTVSSLNVNRIA